MVPTDRVSALQNPGRLPMVTTPAESATWTVNARARGAVAAINLDALRANVGRCREVASGADVMAIVKADAYGHGLVPCAVAARDAGATWLGVALLDEALALRSAGVGGRVLAWLGSPGARWAECIDNDIDISVSARWSLDAVAAAAKSAGRRARVHLKVDTGLSRGGGTIADWSELAQAAHALQSLGLVEVVGLWSHFANADRPAEPSNASQTAAFDSAVDYARGVGLEPEVLHMANSAATFVLPQSRYNLVRPGIAIYGLSPGEEIGTSADLGLTPVMSLRALLASVKQVPAGVGVSYGYEYVTREPTSVGLIPMGYADGLPRAAVNAGPVLAAGRLRTIAGRVSMDQVVVDLGSDPASPGDEVVLFGVDGPTADDWAAACGTIAYEIVTRIGPRVPRAYLGADR